MKNSEQIHVALASDNNYFRGLLVTAVSIVEHCSVPQNIVFHILDGGISEENWSFLKYQLENRQAVVQQLLVEQDVFSQLTAWHGTGKMTYARLLLPDILPNVNHVIYSDVDFLWLDDVAKLWILKNEELSIQFVRQGLRHPSVFAAEDEWLHKHGLSIDPDSYFCAGMILMNLKAFRHNLLHIITLKLLQANGGDAPFVDQTALNVVFSERTDKEELPSSWQTMTSDRSAFTNGFNIVLHYAGDCPWKPIYKTNHFLTDFHLLWHRTYSRICKISIWNSLRADNSIFMILLGRVLYLATCHCPFFRLLLKFYLRIREKDASCLDGIFRLPIIPRESFSPMTT